METDVEVALTRLKAELAIEQIVVNHLVAAGSAAGLVNDATLQSIYEQISAVASADPILKKPMAAVMQRRLDTLKAVYASNKPGR